MQENKEIQAPEPKRRYFFKLNQRVQNKRKEMQKKIAKSKSVDTLSNLSEDFVYNNYHCSTNDLRESDDTESDRQYITTLNIIEQVPIANATYREIQRESRVSELVEDYIIVEKDNNEAEKKFFGDNFLRMSVESINEAYADSDGSTTPSTPQTKLSIRDRISFAVIDKIEKRKEKRKEKENSIKEKETVKQKKKEGRDIVEKIILSNTTKQDGSRINNKHTKVATLTIALIEATGLETDISEDKPRFLFCRFRLGGEKYKSKLIKCHDSVVKWLELFNFNIYEEHILEFSLWDKDSFVGRSIIDLRELEKEKTHRMTINLECDEGKCKLFILLTISGTKHENTLVDLDDHEATQRKLALAKKKYAWYHFQNDTADVGWLSVIVYGAKGLISHENYCILQLGNERLQTQTVSKTNDPNWMKIFSLPVKDITSILEVTIHDEKKAEDVGKISIPLLHINNGQKKWYALKEVTQRERAKGNNPRILLEMTATWNVLRASVRVVNPKEVNYLELEDKFHRHIFARNLSRARAVVNWIINCFQVVKTLFEWESRKLNVIALTLWLVFCWFFRIWMIPLLFLIPFIWYKPQKYVLINWKKYVNKELAVAIFDDPKKEKDEKTSWRQKLNSLTDMVQTVQNFIGTFASYGESVKNLFNFTVPFLSCLAIIIITLGAFVMYLIPVKYIFIIWGIHKFTRKILRPNRIPNNEILDLLSRVPDDETLSDVQELPLEDVEEDVLS